jgi:RHS repeat-associated protein
MIRNFKIITLFLFSIIVYSLQSEVDAALPATSYLSAQQYAPVNLDKTNYVPGAIGGNINIGNSGDAIYQVPIESAPGSHSMQPNISIVYNSKSGNGVLGYGWHITGLSQISRASKNIYYDSNYSGIAMNASDALVFDGARLVSTDTYVYSPENDPSTRVVYNTSTATYTVTTKDGVVMEYGSSGKNANFTAQGATVPYAWSINRITDTEGNYIDFYYTGSSTTGEYYIYEIKYTGNASISPYNSIKFNYTQKNDVSYAYIAGGMVAQSALLSSIVTYCEGNQSKKYDFYYFFDKYSKLNKITLNTDGNQCNPTFINWDNSVALASNFTVTKNSVLSSASDYEYTIYTADINGDGINDLIQKAITPGYPYPSFVVYKGIKGGNFTSIGRVDLPIYSSSSPYYDNYTNLDIQIVDWNNDGKDEVLAHVFDVQQSTSDKTYVKFKQQVYCYSYNGSSFVQTKIYDAEPESYADIYKFYYGNFDNDVKMDRIVTINDIVKEVYIKGASQLTTSINGMLVKDIKTTDFNGNGRIDITLYDVDYNIEVFEYNGSDFDVIDANTTVNFGKPVNTFMGDFNADGKTDMLTYNSGWKLWYSTGTKYIQGTSPISNSLEPALYPYTSVVIADMNNDGKDDILYLNKATVTAYYSNGGSFTNMGSIAITSQTAMTKAFLYTADIGANCSKELLYINDIFTTGNDVYQVFFPTNLDNNLYVKSITNGNGNVSSITYSVYNENATTQLTFPLRKILSPMKMATNIKVTNGSSTILNNTYSFSNAVVHVLGKGFLGFLNVSATDSINNTLVQNVFRTDLYSTTDLFYNWLYTQKKYIAGSLVSTFTNGILYSKGGNSTKKLFFPFIETSTTTDNIKGTSATTTINTFNTTIGRVTKQTVATNDGWSVVSNYTYSVVSNNTSRLTKLITTKQKGADTYTTTVDYAYLNASKQFRVTSQTLQSKITTYYTSFDSWGNVTGTKGSVTDGTPDRTTSCTFDTYGRFILTSTDVTGLISRATYRSFDGAPLTQTDPNGLITSYSYSTGGNTLVSTITLPDNNKITNTIGWDNTGIALHYTQQSATKGNTATTYINAIGQKIKETAIGYNNLALETFYFYNTDGTVNHVTGPGNITMNYSYYNDGRLKRQYNSLNTVDISYSYSGLNVTTTDNILGQTTTQTYDALGNVTQSDGTNGTVTYTYNAQEKPVSIVAAGSTTSITYDNLGNQLTLTDPDAGNTTFTYNGFGQLKTQTDAKQLITSCIYDTYGRLTNKNSSTGDVNVTYVYKTTSGKLGLIDKIINNDVTEQYTYDALNRTESIVTTGKTYKNATALTSFTTQYTYNSDNQVEYITYPSGLKVKYVYDAIGNLTEIDDANTNKLIWKGNAVNDLNQFTQYTLGNGLITNWEYDPATYMLKSIKTGTTTNNTSIQNLGFTFNTKGQLTKRTEGSLSENFEYDALDRLTYAYIGTKPATPDFVYANNGNIQSTMLAGQYEYPGVANPRPHAVTKVNGGTTGSISNIETTSDYFTDNKTKYIDNGTYKNDFVYGIDGNRFRVDFSKNNIPQNSKVYIGNSELGYDPAGNNTYKRTIIYAPTGVCAIYQDSANVKDFYYIHTDYLGSWLTITDNTGSLTNKYSYDAWGRPRDPNTWVLKPINMASALVDLNTMQPRFDRGYTGHEIIAGFGLINMNGRMYDPYLQRFLSPDNYVQDPGNAQNYNRYTYCLNNPLRYTDPSGDTWLSSAWDWTKKSVGKLLATSGKLVSYGALLPVSAIDAIDNGLPRLDPFLKGTKSYNSYLISDGLFQTDHNRSFWEQTWQLVSRFTWEGGQTVLGYNVGQAYNVFWDVDEVSYFGGATLINTNSSNRDKQAMTLGNFIMSNKVRAGIDDDMFMHEYGHTLQGMDYGLAYMFEVGIPSFCDLAFGNGKKKWSGNPDLYNHDVIPCEMEANSYAAAYFKKYYDVPWDDKKTNPRSKDKARTVFDTVEIKLLFLYKINN